MQAIVTRYLPATNTKPTRIKAECSRGSIIISANSSASGDAAHFEAVRALVNRFVNEDQKQYGTPPNQNPWARPYVCGGLPKGSKWACCFVSPVDYFVINAKGE